MGMTLAELAVVLAILVALAAIMVPMFTQTGPLAELDATFQTMLALRNAILGTSNNAGYFPDMKGLTITSTDPDSMAGIPYSINDLFVKPAGAQAFEPAFSRGWRGPYLTQTNGVTPGTNTILDSFPPRAGISGTTPGQPGMPILIQWPAQGTTNRAYHVFLVSYGPDNKSDIDYSQIANPTQMASSAIQDDLILYLRVAPGTGGTPWTNYYSMRGKLSTP